MILKGGRPAVIILSSLLMMRLGTAYPNYWWLEYVAYTLLLVMCVVGMVQLLHQTPPPKQKMSVDTGLLGKVIALKCGIAEMDRDAYTIIENKWDYATGRVHALNEVHELLLDPNKLYGEAVRLKIIKEEESPCPTLQHGSMC